MTSRARVMGAVLLLLALPLAVVAFEAASFYLKASNGSFVSSGEKRHYLLYVPESYDRTRPTPLVISMHGAGLWGAAQMEISRWNEAADEHGFIVVYPSGFRGDGPRLWRVFPGPDLTKDVSFIAELIDTVSAAHSIDPTRIYANGLSNGGGMSFALSCTLSDRIAAVGLVASAQTLPWEWCTDPRPVPMISIHGTADPVTPYRGGTSWISPRAFPDMPAWAASWSGRNQCDPQAIDSVMAADIVRHAYTNCANDADVVLYTIQGGGHTWPGGGRLPHWLVGPSTHSISATNEMWAFFREHPLVGSP